ncbi:hypothetical protein LINPERHAP1_LOCUS29420, partial [Linum perenne]
APKDIPKVPWEEGSKQNSKGLDRFEEGPKLSLPQAQGPCQRPSEEHFWPSQQFTRAF